MGCSGSKQATLNDIEDENDYSKGFKYSNSAVINIQQKFQRGIRIPPEVYVAHFMPSNFPLVPIINRTTARICSDSWNIILNSTVKDDFGNVISGMTVFYNDFYERLAQFDHNGKFEAVLSRHSNGMNKIAAKGAIIIRIIKFLLKIESDNEQTQLMLYILGKSHNQKGIRPWQYSIFVQTLLNTIAARLGTNASLDVMEVRNLINIHLSILH